MARVLRSVLMLGLVTAAACVGYTGTDVTGGTTPTNFAWLNGRVFTVSGQGIGFAQVIVRIPSNRSPSSYQLQGGQTAVTGDYDLLVQRIHDVGAVPTPDTLTLFVIAAQQVAGGTRLDSTQATVRFFPVGQQTNPQTVDVHTSTP